MRISRTKRKSCSAFCAARSGLPERLAALPTFMKTTIRPTPCTSIVMGVLLLAATGFQASCFAQGTAFSYQGQLAQNGNPANGLFDLKFTLFDALSSGSTAAGPVTNSATKVTNGLFMVTLDFGDNFPGADRFLEIAARTNGTGAFTTLSPRQKILAVPYTITAGNLSGTLPSSALTGTYSSPVSLTNSLNSIVGNGGGLTGLNASSLASGTISDARLSANVALLNTAQTFSADKTFGAGTQIFLDQGSATAPGLSFSGDSNTGIYRPVANAVAISGNGVELLRASPSGVGIRTPSPTRDLEVDGAGDVEVGLKSTDVNGHLWTIQSTGVTGDTNRDASFQIIDRTLGVSRLLVDTNGLVGIGTVGPSVRLHVDGGTDASINGGGFVVVGATNGANIAIDNNEIMARNNGSKSTLYLNNDGGSVSIGGPTEGADSTIYLYNPVLTEQSVEPIHDGIYPLGESGHRWYEVWAFNGFIQTSDARSKTNIQALPYGLQTVLSLRPVSFEWKQSSRPSKNLGLIAQEVEPIVPEAVVKDGNPEHPSGMNYSAFIPVLIKALQDQQGLIESQREALAAQQSQIHALADRLRIIEQQK